MKVGSLVELINDKWIDLPLSFETYPVKGVIYTVRDIEEFKDGVYIRLEEIINPKYKSYDFYGECQFNADKFRELLPPITIDIEQFETVKI